MNRMIRPLAAAALAGVVALGCDRSETRTASTSGTPSSTAPAVDVDVKVNKDKADNALDRTGDALARAGEKTKDVASDVAHDTKEGLKTAGRKINDAAHNVADRTSDAVDNAGDRARTASDRGTVAPNGTAAAPDAEGIRDVLAQVTEAALTKGGLDDMVERFVDADRNRLGKEANQNFPDLDGRIDQFRKDWQAKYGKDFNIKNEEKALPASLFSITQGETPRTAASNTGVDRPDSASADANRNDPGRNVASIQVRASHGLPDLIIPMIHEAPDRWKIDVPDTLTADRLKANVLAHLTAADNPAQWPADVNDAYAMVSHHVLMAVLDKPAQQ